MLHASARRLELDEHDNLSRVLVGMRLQASGIRGTLRQATGGRSRASLAAVSLVESVGHLAETLLAVLDAEYGDEAPALIRTRYGQGR